MDYVERDGVWAHQGRQAIFVGDLIDRGPKQIDSVRIARAMAEATTFDPTTRRTTNSTRDFSRQSISVRPCIER
jgi:hypothetical protein